MIIRLVSPGIAIMGKKKKDDPSAAPPPPPMLVGDDKSRTARVPEPRERPLLISPYEVDTGRFQHSSSLSPESLERQSRAQPSLYESVNKALGCFAFLGLVVVSAFVETYFPLSDRKKILGATTVGAVLGLLQLWIDLNNSDLAYIDRDSNRRMARLRNLLRRLVNIPVI
jgi:hypothetical protein